jgi:hypothetical protein
MLLKAMPVAGGRRIWSSAILRLKGGQERGAGVAAATAAATAGGGGGGGGGGARASFLLGSLRPAWARTAARTSWRAMSDEGGGFQRRRGENAGEQRNAGDSDAEGENVDKKQKMGIAFTCTVCETRVARFFTKNSYEKGVVIIKLEEKDGCTVRAPAIPSPCCRHTAYTDILPTHAPKRDAIC